MEKNESLKNVAKFDSSYTAYKSPHSSLVAYRGILPTVPSSVLLADGARVVGDVVLGEESSVWFNVVVRGDVHSIRIGHETNIQDNAVIHCTYKKFSTTIGNRVSIAHLAMLHGCVVEDDCLIGMGAVILDGAVIGAGSIVGAHALVTQGTQIPPRSLVIGAPAKVVSQVTDAQLKSVLETTERYKMYARGYTL